jgi:hypothetical protein
MTDVDELVARLQAIEEALRDLAYDKLREAVDGDEAAREQAKAEEKKLLQARRAIERAVRALDPADRTTDDF